MSGTTEPRLKTFAKNVTTAGTQVRLKTDDLFASEVEIFAKTANTGIIYLGDADVDSSSGRPLAAGQSFAIAKLGDIDGRVNLKNIWIDSSVNGEGVIVSYIQR